MPRHIKNGDTVIVNSGSSKGMTGEIIQVIPKKDQVVVQGVNLRKKHIKPSQSNPQGGMITKEMPLHISKVNPAVDGKGTRVRFITKDDGSKVRVAARNGDELHVLHKGKKK